MDKDTLFYEYYKQWVELYKNGAIREATMAKYLKCVAAYITSSLEANQIRQKSSITFSIHSCFVFSITLRIDSKFKYYAQMMAELRKILEEEIKPLITH